jgi:hypothetical protein
VPSSFSLPHPLLRTAESLQQRAVRPQLRNKTFLIRRLSPHSASSPHSAAPVVITSAIHGTERLAVTRLETPDAVAEPSTGWGVILV